MNFNMGKSGCGGEKGAICLYPARPAVLVPSIRFNAGVILYISYVKLVRHATYDFRCTGWAARGTNVKKDRENEESGAALGQSNRHD